MKFGIPIIMIYQYKKLVRKFGKTFGNLINLNKEYIRQTSFFHFFDIYVLILVSYINFIITLLITTIISYDRSHIMQKISCIMTLV